MPLLCKGRAIMTEEQKQALIEWLKEGIELREEYGFNGNLLASMRVALAALTAQPVKLPKSERLDGNGYGYYFDMNDVFSALEEAGIKFEVQE